MRIGLCNASSRGIDRSLEQSGEGATRVCAATTVVEASFSLRGSGYSSAPHSVTASTIASDVFMFLLVSSFMRRNVEVQVTLSSSHDMERRSIAKRRI